MEQNEQAVFELDLDALQAQFNIAIAETEELVSSWVRPSKKPNQRPKKSVEEIEKELQDYLRRPPRLGVGAPIPEPVGPTAQEEARLKSKLIGNGKKRRHGGDTMENPPLQEDNDDEEGKKGESSTKIVRLDPFSNPKKKAKRKAEAEKLTPSGVDVANSNGTAAPPTSTTAVNGVRTAIHNANAQPSPFANGVLSTPTATSSQDDSSTRRHFEPLKPLSAHDPFISGAPPASLTSAKKRKKKKQKRRHTETNGIVVNGDFDEPSRPVASRSNASIVANETGPSALGEDPDLVASASGSSTPTAPPIPLFVTSTPKDSPTQRRIDMLGPLEAQAPIVPNVHPSKKKKKKKKRKLEQVQPDGGAVDANVVFEQSSSSIADGSTTSIATDDKSSILTECVVTKNPNKANDGQDEWTGFSASVQSELNRDGPRKRIKSKSVDLKRPNGPLNLQQGASSAPVSRPPFTPGCAPLLNLTGPPPFNNAEESIENLSSSKKRRKRRKKKNKRHHNGTEVAS